MVVARKEFQTVRWEEEFQKQEVQKPRKKKGTHRFEKVVFSVGLAAALALSLFVLLRFAAINEARYQVHSLAKELEQLEVQREQLRVEVEKVSKSGRIEALAKEKLNMQYPIAEQIIYININPVDVALASNKVALSSIGERDYNMASSSSLRQVFDKLFGFFKI